MLFLQIEWEIRLDGLLVWSKFFYLAQSRLKLLRTSWTRSGGSSGWPNAPACRWPTRRRPLGQGRRPRSSARSRWPACAPEHLKDHRRSDKGARSLRGCLRSGRRSFRWGTRRHPSPWGTWRHPSTRRTGPDWCTGLRACPIRKVRRICEGCRLKQWREGETLKWSFWVNYGILTPSSNLPLKG